MTFVSRGIGNYRPEEVRRLIEEYPALKARANTNARGLWSLVMMADLERAMEHLDLRRWEAVLLHGLLGLPQEEVARLLTISQQAVSKRYRQGLEDTTWWINGGEE
jgi:DNA-directed RNA polymerase specialized sigma24 family protein